MNVRIEHTNEVLKVKKHIFGAVYAPFNLLIYFETIQNFLSVNEITTFIAMNSKSRITVFAADTLTE